MAVSLAHPAIAANAATKTTGRTLTAYLIITDLLKFP
jgi:hypothetical protein